MNPTLVEDGVKNFMNTTLNNCYQKKIELYSWVINISCFIMFFLLLDSILYLFKKPTLTPYETNEKMQREQEYVVSKIRDYKEMNRSSSRITDLPMA